MPSGMPLINPALVPKETGNRIFASTLEAMRRAQADPEIWGRIDARARQLQAERMMLDGKK